MRASQRLDATLDRLHILLDVFRASQPDDGLNDRERVPRAKVDLSRQQDLTLVCLLAIRDIDRYAVDAHDVARIIQASGRRSDAPADLPIRSHNAKFGLLRACALRHAASNLNERHPIFRMDQRTNVLHRDLEILWIGAENAVLALVPAPLLADQVPIP